MIVQIYGVTTVDDALLCASAGVDHVGVVPEHAGNWDGVSVDEANEILAALPPGVTSVVLSLGTTAEQVVATARAVPGDVVHVVRTDRLGPRELARIRAEVDGPMMATISVDGTDALDHATAVGAVADLLLLDSRHPATGVVGASGHTHDWSVSAAIVERVDRPVILAGGLGPDNVDTAIAAVRPWGVDSETRTSREDDRRRKDPERVRRFVQVARASP